MDVRNLSVLGALLAVIAAPVRATEFDILINEIAYNPFSGDDLDEFVELYNRGPRAVDLSGWSFTEGISYTFNVGWILGPGEYLIVSPNADHAKQFYGIQNVAGDYAGKLDNNGEIITLVNAAGAVISRIHFRDDGPWPGHADGLGPTLELVTPHEQNDLPQKWASSLVLAGTPGRQNSRYQPLQLARVLVSQEDSSRTFKGTAEPSSPLLGWTERGFDASSWLLQPGPFGYSDVGDYIVNTDLTGMRNSYSTFYIRHSFDLDAGTLLDLQSGNLGMSLHVSYDDAFVAYLNGIEVGRENIGAPGSNVLHDALTASSISPEPGSKTVDLGAHVGALLPQGNVLAVQGINGTTLASSDFLLGVEIILSPPAPSADEVQRTVVINEVRPSEPPAMGFLELFNSTGAPAAIGNWVIADGKGHRYRLPAASTMAKGSYLAIGEDQLGLGFPLLPGGRYALLAADGATWVDGIITAVGPGGSSFGCFPDGDADQFVMTSPSQGTMNQLSLETDLVINEILYHPPFVPPSVDCTRQCSDPDQWIEIHNRGAAEKDIGGWSLSKAVDFRFLPGTKIAAGAYLVVAANRARFLMAHPSVGSASVFGDWIRSLARSSDTINLRDAFGNRVDHVEYGDGGPINDEDPKNGIDDRTLAASDWPKAADDGTQGRSLELVNPGLDNRAGAAWRAGPAGGTPAAANAAFSAAPLPVAWDLENEPSAPRSMEAVQITCKASSVSPIAKVDLLWHVDPAGVETAVTLQDDGLSGDGAAGDGVFGGVIPAQIHGTVVAWRVRVQAQDGQTAIQPRSPEVAPYQGFQGPYCLFQVDDGVPPSNGSLTYRIVMTSADLAALRSWYDPASSTLFVNKLFHCTLIGSGKSHHAVGIRRRGENSRRDPPPWAWRLHFPPERKFHGFEAVNFIPTLATSPVETEILAADLFRRAALPYSQEWMVNMVFQGALNPLYVFKENFDGDFLDRTFGGSSGGNLYRAIDPDPAGGQPMGDLTYFGPASNPTAMANYKLVYDKRSNGEEADWSDIIELCRAFNPAQTPDADFPARMRELIDPDEWARFFAVQACLSNGDGGIWTNTGEDFLLYHVPADSPRLDAGKWILLPWDIGETFTNTQERLFRPDVPSIRRFLTHPAFAPLYYANLLDLRDGAFSRIETRQRFYLIDKLFGFGTIDGIDSYITARIGYFDENIPSRLSAGVASGAEAGTALVAIGDTWRYFKGTQEPSGGNKNWANRTGFDDSAWLEGPTGIGYSDIWTYATPLTDMQNNYTTLYARRKFTVVDKALVATLTLGIDSDDGFVAYLNGTEVARRRVTGDVGVPVPFGSLANASHEEGQWETIDLMAYKDLLVTGDNVLAIQTFNRTKDSTDLSMIPELIAGTAAESGGCGNILYAAGASVVLAGSANGAQTAAVKVQGAPAVYDGYRARWTATVNLPAAENSIRVEAFDGAGALIEVRDLKVVRIDRPFTALGGTLAANTSWTKAGGPYVLNQNVTVPAGVTLSIGPGTIILGKPDASIIVRGVIEALGTKAEPILFRAYTCDNRMGGIAIDTTGTDAASPEHHLVFCDMEFGHNPSGYLGTVAPVRSKLLVEDCTFRELTANAIDGTEARLEVRRSLFERIHEGVHCASSTVVVLDCTFSHMVGDKDAIDFDYNGPAGERSRIERSLFEYGSDDGIDLQATSVDIRDNIFRFISDKALSLEENGPVGPPTVTGNLIHDSGTGIALKNGIPINEGWHNTIVGCQEGIYLYAKAGASDGGHGIFDSMVIWNNIYNVKLDTKSTASFTFSDIGGDLWPGQGNISLSPRFKDPLRDDYSLAAGSPAIGTGKGKTDMGSIPYSGPQVLFKRGDADSNGLVDIADAINCLEYLFRSGTGPSCLDRLDSNDDGSIDIADPIYILFYRFAAGPPPPPPFEAQGIDPTGDPLPCV